MRTLCGSSRNSQANPLMGAVEGTGNGELSEQRGSFSSSLPNSLPLPWAGRGGLVLQTCPTLATLDCSLPGSSVYGIFQARILEWVTISFSRGSS